MARISADPKGITGRFAEKESARENIISSDSQPAPKDTSPSTPLSETTLAVAGIGKRPEMSWGKTRIGGGGGSGGVD